MARITVEDCLTEVENRFQLVMIASKRARQLATGGRDPHVEEENDKPTVLALREIADGHVTATILDEVDRRGEDEFGFKLPEPQPSHHDVGDDPSSTKPSGPRRPAPRLAPAETGEPIITLPELSARLQEYLSPEAVAEVERAFRYAEAAHEGQMRKTGHPYITHPTAVAHILAGMRMDPQTLMAALLHDVIEDTGVGKKTLAEAFGSDVAELVDGVSKLTTIFKSRAEAQAENFQKMAMAMARDIRVILVKLADRLHNMRTLGALAREKKERIARETLDYYAPIASRLGMNELRMEFEDLAFQALYPMRAERIGRDRAGSPRPSQGPDGRNRRSAGKVPRQRRH